MQISKRIDLCGALARTNCSVVGRDRGPRGYAIGFAAIRGRCDDIDLDRVHVMAAEIAAKYVANDRVGRATTAEQLA